MERVKEIFYQIMGHLPTKIIPLEQGITNENFLIDDQYVLRFPKEYVQPFNSHLQEIEVEKAVRSLPNSISVPYLDASGIKISLYQKELQPFDVQKAKEEDFAQMALLIKQFHQLTIRTIDDFAPAYRYSGYKSRSHIQQSFAHEKATVEAFCEAFRTRPKQLCHNDLVAGNILCHPEKHLIFMIDFEYAGRNDPLFDLVSFVSENNITDESHILTFLHTYYGDQMPEDLYVLFAIYYRFADILWYYWAKMNARFTGEAIYETIALEKEKRIRREENLYLSSLKSNSLKNN